MREKFNSPFFRKNYDLSPVYVYHGLKRIYTPLAAAIPAHKFWLFRA